MRKATRNRFIAIISFMVAISLSLAPVAHASLVMFDADSNKTTELGYNSDLGVADSSFHQHLESANDTGKSECDQNTGCKMLCSVSVSVLPNMSDPSLSIEKSNRWFSADIVELKPSFLSRLDRPPRP